jgi:hypothetical protein
MMRQYILLVLLFAGISCDQSKPAESSLTQGPSGNLDEPSPENPVYRSIGEIKAPAGYTRIEAAGNSFTGWLRTVPLKEDKTVYLYNGTKKRNQLAQFAVINIPTGNQDLQQCADVVMRLRAEYLFKNKMYKDIAFMDYNRKWYRWDGTDDREKFERYLQTVFNWCGSASLEKQLKGVADFNAIKPGDVLIQGGFPGHAVIVADMAINQEGKKVYLLVQGYQPAQDMHVLVNPNDPALSPWYAVDLDGEDVYTPEWHFKKTGLKTW